MTAVAIRGVSYPVVLPKLKDPRLHLAATITSLQVLGQVAFGFRLSIAQILLALGTAGLLEVAITFRRERVLMWPASALLTGNGVAFVLRVPGTRHGDWWSLHVWWLYVVVAGGSLLSKYVIRWRGEHVFNPSNIGLVVCFLALGRGRAEPLDFWWGPMSWWMGLALVIIVAGGLAILSRIGLLRVAVAFWAAFAASIAVLAWRGHAMTARWHLGPISGFHFWWVLVTSPEVLVFLFFMITDPKTAPTGPRGRVVYGVGLGVLAGALIAPTTTEFAAKVALLSALALVCAAKPFLRYVPRRALAGASAPALAAAGGALLLASPAPPPPLAAAPVRAGVLPHIAIEPSPGVQTQLNTPTAQLIVHALVTAVPAGAADTVRVHLVPGTDQGPPSAVAELGGRIYRLALVGFPNQWKLQGAAPKPATRAPVRVSASFAGLRLENVAPQLGLDFRQGSFRYGMSNDYEAMMGGGLCFLDYNSDGWQDLFVVNSWSDADLPRWEAHGGPPRTALFENVHGRFRDVSARANAGLSVRGDGCAAADLNGDGRPDIVLTTAEGADILWNEGGTFRTQALPARGWYTGAAIADVNGDGRPDVFLAGYTNIDEPIPNAIAGFPTTYAGVRDLLFLNEGGRPTRFREVGVAAGLESAAYSHGLGAAFLDVNSDGRPDLYVANDEDPNQLYVNVPWPGGARADPAGLGFRLEDRAVPEDVADRYAGMGIAAAGYTGDGRLGLFVTNSRREPSAAYLSTGTRFANARPAFLPALGTGFAGWGVSFADLGNTGSPDLVLTAGAIPVTNVAADAEPVRVLTPLAGAHGYGDATGRLLPGGLRVDGRGLAAADVGNDGRVDVAINTIGGKLALLRSVGRVGNWLEVETSPLAPGATVTAELPGGRRLVRQVQAGSSYLSSEDPRVHFGLGSATSVARLVVRFPFGGTRVLRKVAADRVVVVTRPPAAPAARAPTTATVGDCTPRTPSARSLAELWDATAVSVLRQAGASPPVEARTLFRLSTAMWDAWAAYDPAAKGYLVSAKARAADLERARETAISYAAYRVLLWDVSFDRNLARTFATLSARLRSFCYSPGFVDARGASPAALGNRIAAAMIAAGTRDGALESKHFVDTTYEPENDPLVVSQAVSTVHDATFWQPLAFAQVAPQGLAPLPADIQTFAAAQWGRVRSFALPRSGRGLPIDPGAPPLGDPNSASYKDAALAAIRATSRPVAAPPDASPLAWNAIANTLPHPARAAQRLRFDVRLYLTLNAALHDAAIAAWGAKRTYQSPRPISMIRYLAFQGQSSDKRSASYARDGLPLVHGLTELSTTGQVLVLERGRWVPGASWTPSEPTPPSPGWISEESTFAYAADGVLTALTGRSLAGDAARLAQAGVDGGIETAADEAAGREVGAHVARLVLAKARGYVGR